MVFPRAHGAVIYHIHGRRIAPGDGTCGVPPAPIRVSTCAVCIFQHILCGPLPDLTKRATIRQNRAPLRASYCPGLPICGRACAIALLSCKNILRARCRVRKLRCLFLASVKLCSMFFPCFIHLTHEALCVCSAFVSSICVVPSRARIVP